jgi:FlaA1/EpsC-like NDP-sugar epimerase
MPAMEHIHPRNDHWQSAEPTDFGRLRPELEPVPACLSAMLTGRSEPWFAADLRAHQRAVTGAVHRSRFLVIGGAGSIGAVFVRLLAGMSPRALGIVDIDENGLADLVRDLRSSSIPLPKDVTTVVAALGSRAFERFFMSGKRWDVVLNFAALKHVRSERDPYSLMRMIEVNVLGLEKLIALAEQRGTNRLFSVSSDKAVAPTNLMGATKRWMELLLAVPRRNMICSSARFANVAFSKGGLPRAFLDRLAKRQPLAAPDDVRRYFISHQEAAQLCLLSSLLAEAGEIFVPRLDAKRHALSMDEAARRVLRYHGLAAYPCGSADMAVHHPALREVNAGVWPCWFSPSDTSGEKAIEELWTDNETRDQSRFESLAIIHPTAAPPGHLVEARERVLAVARASRWEKGDLAAAIKLAVPELRHREENRSLDDKL